MKQVAAKDEYKAHQNGAIQHTDEPRHASSRYISLYLRSFSLLHRETPSVTKPEELAPTTSFFATRSPLGVALLPLGVLSNFAPGHIHRHCQIRVNTNKYRNKYGDNMNLVLRGTS